MGAIRKMLFEERRRQINHLWKIDPRSEPFVMPLLMRKNQPKQIVDLPGRILLEALREAAQ
jgi:hypothetical protein